MTEEQKTKFVLSADKVAERVTQMPAIETYWQKSKDSKYIMVKTVFTEIKPLSYVKAVMESENKEEAK